MARAFRLGGVGSPCCCEGTLIIKVNGCGSVGVPGLTVTVYELDGTTVAFTGTTNSSGNVTATGVSGTRRVTVTGSARWATFDASVVLSALTIITLTVASGYHCACCPKPFADTLNVTPKLFPTMAPLVWTATPAFGGPAAWESHSAGGTGFVFTVACQLKMYISGTLCMTMTPHTLDCSGLIVTYVSSAAPGAPCFQPGGTTFTLTE